MKTTLRGPGMVYYLGPRGPYMALGGLTYM